jgi:copper resistance protein D
VGRVETRGLNDPIVYVRAVQFAATIMAAGIAFFMVGIAEPAFRAGAGKSGIAAVVRPWFAAIAWSSLALVVFSGAAWLLLVAASMSGRPLAWVFRDDVVWIVLTQTDFGRDCLVRLLLAGLLAATFAPMFSAARKHPAWLQTAMAATAAALVGSLAWTGHAIGSQGAEGIIHPAADVLHLVAAGAWVGMLVPLALLLGAAERDDPSVMIARTATLRFSAIGIASVATLLITGIVNTWYLAGSVTALTESGYGRLLSLKIAIFVGMVAIAGINRLWLTPQLLGSSSIAAARHALRRLRRNAAIEAAMGAAVIAVVAALGTLPPASHAQHHNAEGVIPADASFQHIHGLDGMADVMIEPGRVGTANVTIHLWNNDLETLAVRNVTLTLTAPTPGSRPMTRAAIRDADGAWHVDGVRLSEPGNWTVSVDALLASGARLDLTAPIVIDAD